MLVEISGNQLLYSLQSDRLFLSSLLRCFATACDHTSFSVAEKFQPFLSNKTDFFRKKLHSNKFQANSSSCAREAKKPFAQCTKVFWYTWAENSVLSRHGILCSHAASYLNEVGSRAGINSRYMNGCWKWHPQLQSSKDLRESE